MGHGHDTVSDRCDRRIVRRPAQRMAALLPRIFSNDVSQMSWAGMLARVFEQETIVPLRVELKPSLTRACSPVPSRPLPRRPVPKSDSTVFARTVKLTWP